MKKLISMLLCFAVVLSLTAAVLATEGQQEPEAGSSADVKTYVFVDYDLPTVKGEIQGTKLDDVLSVGASHGFKDVKRGVFAIAKDQKMMITSTRGISKLVLNATSNDSPISVEVSADGVNWTCTHEEIMLYTEYEDIEITFKTSATHIRISTNALMRVKTMTVEYVAAEQPVAPSKPEAPTTAPQAPTTAPQAPTTVPQAPTTVPQAPSTVPQAPTTAPQAPTTAPQAPTTQPSTPSTPVDPNGDGTFMVIALAVLSMTALVVLVSKKRAF